MKKLISLRNGNFYLSQTEDYNPEQPLRNLQELFLLLEVKAQLYKFLTQRAVP